MDNSAIMGDEIIESYDEEIKTVSTTFNEKKAICKMQNFYILLALYYNITLYYCIIDAYYYLLVFDEIWTKAKTFITISRHK